MDATLLELLRKNFSRRPEDALKKEELEVLRAARASVSKDVWREWEAAGRAAHRQHRAAVKGAQQAVSAHERVDARAGDVHSPVDGAVDGVGAGHACSTGGSGAQSPSPALGSTMHTHNASCSVDSGSGDSSGDSSGNSSDSSNGVLQQAVCTTGGAQGGADTSARRASSGVADSAAVAASCVPRAHPAQLHTAHSAPTRSAVRNSWLEEEHALVVTPMVVPGAGAASAGHVTNTAPHAAVTRTLPSGGDAWIEDVAAWPPADSSMVTHVASSRAVQPAQAPDMRTNGLDKPPRLRGRQRERTHLHRGSGSSVDSVRSDRSSASARSVSRGAGIRHTAAALEHSGAHHSHDVPDAHDAPDAHGALTHTASPASEETLVPVPKQMGVPASALPRAVATIPPPEGTHTTHDDAVDARTTASAAPSRATATNVHPPPREGATWVDVHVPRASTLDWSPPTHRGRDSADVAFTSVPSTAAATPTNAWPSFTEDSMDEAAAGTHVDEDAGDVVNPTRPPLDTWPTDEQSSHFSVRPLPAIELDAHSSLQVDVGNMSYLSAGSYPSVHDAASPDATHDSSATDTAVPNDGAPQFARRMSMHEVIGRVSDIDHGVQTDAASAHGSAATSAKTHATLAAPPSSALASPIANKREGQLPRSRGGRVPRAGAVAPASAASVSDTNAPTTAEGTPTMPALSAPAVVPVADERTVTVAARGGKAPSASVGILFARKPPLPHAVPVADSTPRIVGSAAAATTGPASACCHTCGAPCVTGAMDGGQCFTCVASSHREQLHSAQGRRSVDVSQGSLQSSAPHDGASGADDADAAGIQQPSAKLRAPPATLDVAASRRPRRSLSVQRVAGADVRPPHAQQLPSCMLPSQPVAGIRAFAASVIAQAHDIIASTTGAATPRNAPAAMCTELRRPRGSSATSRVATTTTDVTTTTATINPTQCSDIAAPGAHADAPVEQGGSAPCRKRPTPATVFRPAIWPTNAARIPQGKELPALSAHDAHTLMQRYSVAVQHAQQREREEGPAASPSDTARADALRSRATTFVTARRSAPIRASVQLLHSSAPHHTMRRDNARDARGVCGATSQREGGGASDENTAPGYNTAPAQKAGCSRFSLWDAAAAAAATAAADARLSTGRAVTTLTSAARPRTAQMRSASTLGRSCAAQSTPHTDTRGMVAAGVSTVSRGRAARPVSEGPAPQRSASRASTSRAMPPPLPLALPTRTETRVHTSPRAVPRLGANPQLQASARPVTIVICNGGVHQPAATSMATPCRDPSASSEPTLPLHTSSDMLPTCVCVEESGRVVIECLPAPPVERALQETRELSGAQGNRAAASSTDTVSRPLQSTSVRSCSDDAGSSPVCAAPQHSTSEQDRLHVSHITRTALQRAREELSSVHAELSAHRTHSEQLVRTPSTGGSAHAPVAAHIDHAHVPAQRPQTNALEGFASTSSCTNEVRGSSARSAAAVTGALRLAAAVLQPSACVTSARVAQHATAGTLPDDAPREHSLRALRSAIAATVAQLSELRVLQREHVS